MDVDSGRVEVALDEGGEAVLLRPANATLRALESQLVVNSGFCPQVYPSPFLTWR